MIRYEWEHSQNCGLLAHAPICNKTCLYLVSHTSGPSISREKGSGDLVYSELFAWNAIITKKLMLWTTAKDCMAGYVRVRYK